MDSAEAYEQQNVHEVYQQIAGHFSATRYKVCSCQCSLALPAQLTHFPNQPWPIVEKFLKELPAGSVGLDVGCGNGKNLMVNKDVFIVASDRYVLYTMGGPMPLNFSHFSFNFFFLIGVSYDYSTSDLILSHSPCISTWTDPVVQIGKPGSDCNQAPAPFSCRG